MPPIAGHQLPSSNAPMLATLLTDPSALVTDLGIAPDILAAIVAAIDRARGRRYHHHYRWRISRRSRSGQTCIRSSRCKARFLESGAASRQAVNGGNARQIDCARSARQSGLGVRDREPVCQAVDRSTWWNLRRRARDTGKRRWLSRSAATANARISCEAHGGMAA